MKLASQVCCTFNEDAINFFDHIFLLSAANMTVSSCYSWKCERKPGHRCLFNNFPGISVDYHILICTHCGEVMISMGCCGSLSLLFMMKVMVWHFASDSHKDMTAFIVGSLWKSCLEISLQSHRYVINSICSLVTIMLG